MKTVIGCEIHLQINTSKKLFCSCLNEFSEVPNINICEVCSGQLGALPVLNEEVLDPALKLAKALNFKIRDFLRFDRKHYFYPDLPKGFQITQFFSPYCYDGFLMISNKKVGLWEAHLEEDAAKCLHIGNNSYLDMNRCSVPLIEIVTAPDMSDENEVVEFLNKLISMIRYLDISSANLELGSLRCDVNISVEFKNKKSQRNEIKNLNSIDAVRKAIIYESERHINLLKRGLNTEFETRLWNEREMITKSMRKKESFAEYMYFNESDIPSIPLENMKSIFLPEFSDKKSERFVRDYKISKYEADILCLNKDMANYFEESVVISKDAKKCSNWIITNLISVLNNQKITIKNFKVSSENFGKLVGLISSGKINDTTAKEVFKIMIQDNQDPISIIDKRGMSKVSDETLIKKWIDEVKLEHKKSFFESDFNDRAFHFLVGKVLKLSSGKADLEVVKKMIRAEEKK